MDSQNQPWRDFKNNSIWFLLCKWRDWSPRRSSCLSRVRLLLMADQNWNSGLQMASPMVCTLYTSFLIVWGGAVGKKKRKAEKKGKGTRYSLPTYWKPDLFATAGAQSFPLPCALQSHQVKETQPSYQEACTEFCLLHTLSIHWGTNCGIPIISLVLLWLN